MYHDTVNFRTQGAARRSSSIDEDAYRGDILLSQMSTMACTEYGDDNRSKVNQRLISKPGDSRPKMMPGNNGRGHAIAKDRQIDRNRSPVERTYTPVERTYTPVERTYTPVERTYTPVERTYTPVERTYTPVERTYTPVERTYTPTNRRYSVTSNRSVSRNDSRMVSVNGRNVSITEQIDLKNQDPNRVYTSVQYSPHPGDKVRRYRDSTPNGTSSMPIGARMVSIPQGVPRVSIPPVHYRSPSYTMDTGNRYKADSVMESEYQEQRKPRAESYNYGMERSNRPHTDNSNTRAVSRDVPRSTSRPAVSRDGPKIGARRSISVTNARNDIRQSGLYPKDDRTISNRPSAPIPVQTIPHMIHDSSVNGEVNNTNQYYKQRSMGSNPTTASAPSPSGYSATVSPLGGSPKSVNRSRSSSYKPGLLYKIATDQV